MLAIGLCTATVLTSGTLTNLATFLKHLNPNSKQQFDVKAANADKHPKNCHNVSVITKERCVLLRVRRADFAELSDNSLLSDFDSSISAANSCSVANSSQSTFATLTTSADSATTQVPGQLSGSTSQAALQSLGALSTSPFSSFTSLNKLATFQLILSKQQFERTGEEVDIVHEELQHLKALSHLTVGVRRQLAACVTSERCPLADTVIFKQGDVGDCWYIILRGSVSVVIVGKGVVCTLREGDDFGKLALVNDAPRAATIVTNEPNCYFLCVNKRDFNSILRHVEANTVRLREHGREVLVLQKLASSHGSAPAAQQPATGAQSQSQSQLQSQLQSESASSRQLLSSETALKYVVMAGSPDKMLEHLLETRLDGCTECAPVALSKSAILAHDSLVPYLHAQASVQQTPANWTLASIVSSSLFAINNDDTFLEDFILTHKIFLPTQSLCRELLRHFACISSVNSVSEQLNAAHFEALQSVAARRASCDTGLLERQRNLKCDLDSSPQDAFLRSNDDSSIASAAKQQSMQLAALHPSAANYAKLKTSSIEHRLNADFIVSKKRRVVKFVKSWMLIAREAFFESVSVHQMLNELRSRLVDDTATFGKHTLSAEFRTICAICELHVDDDDSVRVPLAASACTPSVASLVDACHAHQLAAKALQQSANMNGDSCLPQKVQRWVHDTYGSVLPVRRFVGTWELSAGASSQLCDTFLAAVGERRFELKLQAAIKAHDEIVLRVYATDHSFAALRVRVNQCAREVKLLAASKLTSAPIDESRDNARYALVHVKSNNERLLIGDDDVNFATSVSVCGRLFVVLSEHLDAICALPEQDVFRNLRRVSSQAASSALSSAHSDSTSGQSMQQSGNTASSEQHITSHLISSTAQLGSQLDIRKQMHLSAQKLDEFSSRDVAFCLMQFAWCLLRNMHELELVSTVFKQYDGAQESRFESSGAQTSFSAFDELRAGQFKARRGVSADDSQQSAGDDLRASTANLNVLLRHFNELQYWVVTQVVLCSSLSKRVQVLRKFIKIAAYCKDAQNLNAFFAIVMGLSNIAVARLTLTWEKLPSKLKRTFCQFEALIDPSRNHRRYRLFVAQMRPPIVPFMPLFLKDMTFAHEGNKTRLESGLINFEKMTLIGATMRTIRACKSRQLKLDASVACKFKGSLRSIELYFRDLKVIDNQRTLTALSQQLEQRKS